MTETLQRRAQEIYDRLLAHYGLPIWREPLPAIDELVCTILSQNTNDVNRDKAFDRLKEVYPSWEQVRDADPEGVKEAVRIAGLANQKGPRIQAVLKQISDERGELDLDFLKEWPAEEVLAWLTRFNGVGLKTASIVMQFSLDIPAFPVDTHVFRVSGRLGLRPAEMNVEKAHIHLASLFAPDTFGPAHLNIIRLGREICNARKPLCEICPISGLCDYARATGI
jgi:endonuclease-3